MMIGRPAETEYAEWYAGYIRSVAEDGVLDLLRRQPAELTVLLVQVPAARETYAYAPGKWTIRQVVSHLIDGERVFGYRAFCIGHGETNPLPGFDENQYVVHSNAKDQPLTALIDEFDKVRQANLACLERIDPSGWRNIGVANSQPISTRALAYIMAGHVRHHFGILQTRYGLAGS